MRSVIDWLEVYRGIPATCNKDFYVSAWWKLGFGELDFRFGKPIHSGPMANGDDEFVLLLSEYGNRSEVENGRGVNVWICLPPKKLKLFMIHVFEV